MLLQKVTQRTLDIVNGYMKQAQLLLPCKDNSYYNIPELVNVICTDFYKNPEYFAKYDQDALQLDEEKTTIIPKVESFATCYGSINIVNDNVSKCIWQFKILSQNGIIAIGIDSSNKQYFDQDFHDCGNDQPYYAIELYRDWTILSYTYNRAIPAYLDTVDDSSKIFIKMELNLKNKTLKYYFGDIDGVVAFKNIYFDETTVYHMAVYTERSSVKLIDFVQE